MRHDHLAIYGAWDEGRGRIVIKQSNAAHKSKNQIPLVIPPYHTTPKKNQNNQNTGSIPVNITHWERPPKTLSTVNADGERAFVPPSRLAWAEGGSIFRIARLSFSAQKKGRVSLLNAFYVTNATHTIIFAIFVSMNPPN